MPLSIKENAVRAPVMPDPMITYFEDSGSGAVALALRCENALVVLCQYDKQPSDRGNDGSILVLVVALGVGGGLTA